MRTGSLNEIYACDQVNHNLNIPFITISQEMCVKTMALNPMIMNGMIYMTCLLEF